MSTLPGFYFRHMHGEVWRIIFDNTKDPFTEMGAAKIGEDFLLHPDGGKPHEMWNASSSGVIVRWHEGEWLEEVPADEAAVYVRSTGRAMLYSKGTILEDYKEALARYGFPTEDSAKSYESTRMILADRCEESGDRFAKVLRANERLQSWIRL